MMWEYPIQARQLYKSTPRRQYLTPPATLLSPIGMLEATTHQPSLRMIFKDIKNCAKSTRIKHAVRINEGKTVSSRNRSTSVAPRSKADIPATLDQLNTRLLKSQLAQAPDRFHIRSIQHQDQFNQFRLSQHAVYAQPQNRTGVINHDNRRETALGRCDA